ncbi:uncharacterized protein LOC114350440 [Ostrinia furnacalis]|uniref:uncharacterized protein LOC114350440 n=1 Tax=Ostrinia furnacalis TaxID=93504 RepID=UPI00103FEC67|nr:uncharacterized protein LOC114350440 [Ostrinia furnacalis]
MVIDKNSVYRRNLPRGRLKFTDFIKHVIGILSTYDDSDLEDVLTIVDDEMRKYHYKGCKFHELVEDINVRRFMADNLEKMKNAPAKVVKDELKKMLRKFEDENMGLMQKTVMDYVNTLYGAKSDAKFKEVLNNLALYKSKSKRSSVNLVKVVRDGIRSIIFDHYSSLEPQRRRDLKIKLETFWNDFGHPERSHHYVWQFRPFNNDETKKKENHVEGEESASYELKTTPKRHKHAKNVPKHKPDRKVKRERERDDETTRRRLTFITLYPESITFLEKRRHKKKSTTKKINVRSKEHRSKSRHRKKHKPVREIVAEHEAVINVEREQFTDTDDEPTTVRSHKKSRFVKTSRSKKKRYRSTERTNSYKKQMKSKKPRFKHHTEEFRRHKLTSKLESDEGLSISFDDEDASDVVTKSFRKNNANDTLQVNHTAGSNNTTVNAVPVADTVIKRIDHLEKEIKDVKEQMKVRKESDETPHYEPLDFWVGTTKPATTKSTTKPTTTRPTTTKTTRVTTTTTRPKTTTARTTQSTTKVVDNTFAYDSVVFRANPTNGTKDEKKIPKKEEKTTVKEVTHKKVTEKNATTKKSTEKKSTAKVVVEKKEGEVSLPGGMPMPHADSDPLKLDQPVEDDYYNDIDGANMNLTRFEDIEKYLNETNPVHDQTGSMVRQQMLDKLKGLFSGSPVLTNATDYIPTLPPIPSLNEEGTDPLKFLDEVDLTNK